MPPVELLVLVALFGLDAFYSAAEIAINSLSRFQLAELAEAHPRYAPMLERFRSNPSQLLTTILVSSNLVVIAFSSVATAFALRLAGGGSGAAAEVLTIGLSLLAILCAEIAPKVVAKRRPYETAELALPGLRFSEALLGPFIRVLVWLIRWMTRPFGGIEGTSLPILSEKELVHIVDEGAKGGVLEKEEAGMIRSVLEFGDTVVREVMVPRAEMVGLPVDASLDRCLDLFIEGGYSRLPVYRDSFDQIVGILYAKDFLAMMKERELILLADVLRPAMFVPETRKVSELLREFRRGKGHLAIVVDERGVPSGLVTLEDLVEEIVGDIQDEYDLESEGGRDA